MTFQNVRFPDKLAYGATGGPMFHTTVLELDSGHEQRNVDWADQRCRYSIDHLNRSDDELETLLNFFYARRGKAYGFRFRDWSDYTLERQVIGQNDGSTTDFQIYKRYTSNAVNFDRTLTKIVADADVITQAVAVWVNSVSITEGAGAGEFTIDRDTGIITLGATLAAASGQDVEVACEFDVPVRFNSDNMNAILSGYQTNSWQGIELVEIRDIA